MIERIIIAGSGGQGVMLLGKVLAQAAMEEGKFVSWFPCYGAEVRGGTAYCMVVISDKQIGSPYIQQADTLIIMNELSLEKFKGRVKKGGLLIVNSSLIPKYMNNNISVLQLPFTDTALKLGNIKVANMAALGCFLTQKKIVSLKGVEHVISEIAPQDKKGLIEINRKALNEGAKLK
ncbi:MAG: 2-oxoacid:acceptor oxidoreductase family protein [Candidatus Omnitrophica bacterium]|nr:2-oxoacid:acceptor oxidoreductase family protein [Candidatus Omnitrophota bacterium]